MKVAPTDEEAAAIAAALLHDAAPHPQTHGIEAPSRWREAARRESVAANVPATWRG
jgi:hypothetical protein